MLKFVEGDILKADTEALVNTVNCVGVMGRGIALQFRKAFPGNYKVYRAICKRGELEPGKLLVHEVGKLTYPRYIINFPTKKHWKGNSRLEYIDAGLKTLVAEIERLQIRSIALPPLGSGLGGLPWAEVRSRIQQAFADVPDISVLVFEPVGAPVPALMAKPQRKPRMTAGRAALLGLVHRYLAALMDPFVSLLEVHKLMYFMQEVGEDLRLSYSKAPYGPYAENLRHVLSAIEGYYITGYGDAEDLPRKRIQLVGNSGTHAEKLLRSRVESRSRFDRVIDLIEGFETPFGMELLATVHWVATREQPRSAAELVDKFYSWGPHKKMFDPRQVNLTWKVLKEKGWLAPGLAN